MQCPDCGASSTHAAAAYCDRCGSRLARATTQPQRIFLISVVPPAVALVASFLPWLTVGVVTRTRHWNAYHIGGFSWLWLALDCGAIILVAFARFRPVAYWLRLAWTLFAGLSLGVGISAFVLVKVSARVSSILSAPDPLRTSYGLLVFVIATTAWCVASLWFGRRNPSVTSSRIRASSIQP